MTISININQLISPGLDANSAQSLLSVLDPILRDASSNTEKWRKISSILIAHRAPFPVHHQLFSTLFPEWPDALDSAPAWLPDELTLKNANISKLMTAQGHQTVRALHEWSVSSCKIFWQTIVDTLPISFKTQPSQIIDLSKGMETPRWFPDAKMNIADSCFTAPPDMTALVYEDTQKQLRTMTFAELNRLSNRVANSLIQAGFTAGDAIGIAMPMNPFAVAIYLGIIKMGGVVVSIADSFSSQEMAVRLDIAKAKAIFTQDHSLWSSKAIPLYEKIRRANAPVAIVLPCGEQLTVTLRKTDHEWATFLSNNEKFIAAACDPMSACNILFSSGTTAAPKAIPWNHTTPIKAASDAYFHFNIHAGDVLAWPTNLGWMMGPWLIFAAFINHAAIALYPDAPKTRDFGVFVERARVSMLGVVPTLVSAWRQSRCMEGLDWHHINLFGSTGECSNPEDMFYLMWLAGYKPVIEYCGGTEIGGAYLSSTVVEPNYPSMFTTPTLGLSIAILDESGHPADTGEVAIIPPSLGLSVELLNADHHDVYYKNMPALKEKILRRHGDEIKVFPNGAYAILGRVDDTMNLGGIKVSAAEIERAINSIPDLGEAAAIAVAPPDNGPSLLVVYITAPANPDKSQIIRQLQKQINQHLNPLFKIHDVIFVDELPKTASNKIMRRQLRKQYQGTLK